MAFWSSISFQNLLGNTYSFLESLHDFIMVWLLVILMLVTFISYKVFLSMKSYLLPDSLVLEQTWTLIPMLILLTIAYPSIHLLCTQDAMCTNPFYTVKVVSNQWNWQSETLDVLDHLLDSEKLDELSSYDYPFLLPLSEVTRIMVSSSDVLHSLGFPSLGVKLDSSPGRLNVTTVEASSLGLMMGSCYELCGSGHSAMPIYALVI